MIEDDYKLYKKATKINPDLLVFPIVSAFLLFVINVTDKSFDISKIGNINIWAGSFATSFLIYMVFDIVLSKVPFLRRHKYIFIGISFVLSTIVSNCVEYTVYEDFGYDYIRRLTPIFIIDIALLITCIIIGLKIGIQKQIEEKEKEYNDFRLLIQSMSKEEKEKVVKLCKKAINVNNDVFELITKFQNKHIIETLIQEITSDNKKD